MTTYETTYDFNREILIEYGICVRTPRTLKSVSYMTGVVPFVTLRGPEHHMECVGGWAAGIYTLHNSEIVSHPTERKHFATREQAQAWAKKAVKIRCEKAMARQGRQRRSGQHRR